MFHDALAHLKRKIQSGKIQIALLELLDDPQRMKIVIEALAMLAHAFVELLFSGVAEGRVADVVNQSESLGKIGVDSQRARHRARDLRHFQRVREPVAKMVGETHGEDLRLRFEPAKRARVNHAVAVARRSRCGRDAALPGSAGRATAAHPWRRMQAPSQSFYCNAVFDRYGRSVGLLAPRKTPP